MMATNPETVPCSLGMVQQVVAQHEEESNRIETHRNYHDGYGDVVAGSESRVELRGDVQIKQCCHGYILCQCHQVIHAGPHTSTTTLRVKVHKNVHGSCNQVKGYLQAKSPRKLELAVTLPLDVRAECGPLQQQDKNHEDPMSSHERHHKVAIDVGKHHQRYHTRCNHEEVPQSLRDVGRKDDATRLSRDPVIGGKGEGRVEHRHYADAQCREQCWGVGV
jgi:hypothetical protein